MRYIVFGFFLILGDIVSKYLAQNYLSERISLIGDFLYLDYIQNPGIAFGIALTGLPLKILTILLIGILFWYYIRYEKQKNIFLLNLSFVLILAGAIGNAYERIFQGYVVDFIGVKYFSILNIADIYVTLGVILYIYTITFIKNYDSSKG